MKISSRAFVPFLFIMALAAGQYWVSNAQAQSTYFTSRGCIDCHGTPVVASCNACHYHGNRSLSAATNKTSYTPGETVSVTLTSGSTRSGWIKAILYDQTGAQVAVSSGSASGMGGSTTFPATLTAPAPATAGSYTWKMAYFGNSANSGDVHGEVAVNTNTFSVAAPADISAPVVTFTLPATATNLTILVSSFIATDNVGVTGYMITTSATAPAASAAGWSTTAPASVTAAAGSNTFYAWAKDAAGNVSAVKSATVVVTLPDATAPVVTFSLPATATNLTILVSSFTATDNLAVIGYMITTSATAPAASASGWSTTAPASVTAVAGSNTFYAWAKDAAGNVSAVKSATVVVTLPDVTDTTKPALSVSAIANGASTNVATLNVSGSATDAGGLQSVTVNGQAVVVNTDGSFSIAVTLTAGANTITVIASDKAGNQQTDVRTITYDGTVPVLSVSAPADNSSTTQSFVTVTGTVSETSKVTVSDNSGNTQNASINGNTYSATVYLVPGVNTITITATDLAGNTSSEKRTVTYDGGNLTLAVTYPSQDITTSSSSLVLKGTILDALGKVTVKITMNDRTYTPRVRNGSFAQKLIFTKANQYAITVIAADEANNISTVSRNVIYRPTEHDDHERDSYKDASDERDSYEDDLNEHEDD